MHELSIALSIVDMAAYEMQRHDGARLHAIHLRLGPLAGVVKEALLSAYEMPRARWSHSETPRLLSKTCR